MTISRVTMTLAGMAFADGYIVDVGEITEPNTLATVFVCEPGLEEGLIIKYNVSSLDFTSHFTKL